MKVLVIGAAGNLGISLCQELCSRGHTVFGLCRPESQVGAGVEKIGMDLRSFDESRLPPVDAVYFLAQSRHFRDFPDKWDDIFEINVTIPLKFADWARRIGCKSFHYASSGGVYQGGDFAVRENAQINANRDMGFYFGSRLSAEILLRNFASYFTTFTLVRPFFIYGPNQARSMLIPRLVDSIRDGKEVTLNGNDGIKINPIHVRDASKACCDLLKLKGFHAMNLAGAEVLSLREIGNKIGHALGKTPNFKVLDTTSADLIGDTDQMFEHLSKPEITFSAGVKDLI